MNELIHNRLITNFIVLLSWSLAQTLLKEVNNYLVINSILYSLITVLSKLPDSIAPTIANDKLLFQNEEKEKLPAELVVAREFRIAATILEPQ
ncbi:MAG: hypothetical protein ACI9YH_000420 [Colwellia sp.]